MRDKKRIKRILNKLEQTWEEHSDMRFGQLLINMGIIEDTYRVWSNEDDVLEEYLNNFKW